ncbi:MAG: hypothetical protein KJ558_07290 [Gammaproteobacteria bacterium]|nr:hypothetical protein [Gammaproteobacteria bacterium]MBU1654621.1 hypothetical protein [Gammaproteobacteria bacterium]MBU1959951.1 hypothetical protein [Gammaproteobacteria bacterium]
MGRREHYLALTLTSLALALLITKQVDGTDLWWNLNSGLWMLEHHQILLKDYWSFTAFGSDWLNASWLFQVWMAIAYRVGDAWGLLALKYLFTWLALLFLVAASAGKGRFGAFLLAFLLLLPLIYGNLYIRPLIFEFAAISFMVWVSQRPFDKLIALATLLVLIGWANCHGSAIVGAVAMAIQAALAPWPSEKGRRVPLLFATLFLISPFLSPLGFQVLDLLLAHEGSNAKNIYIVEWIRQKTFPPLLWLPFLAVTTGTLLKRLRLSPAEVFLLLFFLFFSTRSQRFELEFAVLLLRPLTVIIGEALGYLQDRGTAYPRLVTALLITGHLFIYQEQIGGLALFQPTGWPIYGPSYPSVTTDMAKSISDSLGRPLRVINKYDFGGYIPFRTQGAVQVMVDGRTPTVFPETFLVLSYREDPHLLDRLRDRYNADAVMLHLRSAGLLHGSGLWTLVGYDPVSVLYLRSDLARNLNLPRIEYNPASYSNQANDRLMTNIAATEQLLRFSRSNSLALNHLALFKSASAKSGTEWDEVHGLLRLADQANPRDGFARATLAFFLAQAASTKERNALERFLTALPPPKDLIYDIPTNNDLTYAAVLIDAGMSDIAKGYLYPAQPERRMALDALAETWRQRTLVELNLGRLTAAAQSLEMARLLYPAEDEHHQQLDGLAKSLRKR